MTSARLRLRRPLNWIGPIIGVVGLAAVAAMFLHDASHRSLFEEGVLSVVLSVDRALPIVGLGLALSVAGPGEGASGALLFALSVFLGFASREWLYAMIAGGPAALGRFRLIGPLACLAVGVALAAPRWIRRWVLAPAAVGLGVLLALAADISDPGVHQAGFPLGAIAAILWLVSAVALTGRRFARPWLGTAVRIFGSWLIAIGLLLGGVALAPRPGPGKSPPVYTPQPPGSTGESPFPGRPDFRP
jgi:hypothetical protein